MSVIVTVIKQKTLNAATALRFQKLFKTSVQDIKARVSAGSPILALEMFDGDLLERIALLRTVISIIEGAGLEADYYELASGEPYEGNHQLDSCRVDVQMLENMMNATEQELERQHS